MLFRALRGKTRGRMPCLFGRMTQSRLVLIFAIVAILGKTDYVLGSTSSSSSSSEQTIPQQGATQSHSTLLTLQGKKHTPLSPPFPGAPGESKRRVVQEEGKTAEEEAQRMLSLNKLDTVLQQHVVPVDWLRQAGDAHRKKKEKERRASKKGSPKGKSRHTEVREKKGSKPPKEGKGEAKHERKKSKGDDKKAKDRSKHKKEDRAKEKKGKDEKGKHAKPGKTTPKKTKKPSKEAKPRPEERRGLPAIAPPAKAPGKEPKPKRDTTTLTRPGRVYIPEERLPPPGEEADKQRPGLPPIPTIAFVGKRPKRAPPSRLQQDLDALCTKHFRTLCRAQEGQSPFCQGTPAVARLTSDSGALDGKMQWRCYDGNVADTEEAGMRCVDECGGEVRCAGKFNPKKHVSSEPLRELSKFVDRRKWIYCSSFQYAASALCNFKKAGNVARYDPHRARWMCLDPVDIALESTGYCADNCGGTIACAGGVMPGETPARTVYIVHNDNIVEAFAALQPCKGPDEVCVATRLNPPKCVAAGSPGAILKLSHQQAAMNKLCQREVDALCRQGKWQKHCFEPWIARKIGPSSSAEHSPGSSSGLACYPREGLNFANLSRCFDGCSEAPCPGQPYSPNVPRIVLPELEEIARNPFYCSPFQAAGNKYCSVQRGPGFVARQHNVTREWQCFRNDELPPKGWTGCANNCGAFTTCASGSIDGDPSLQEDHALEQAIRSTAPPCLSEEECEATPLNPPYCTQTRPNPQPVLTSPTEIAKELGCADVPIEGQSDSRVSPYGGTSQFSTLTWLRSKAE